MSLAGQQAARPHVTLYRSCHFHFLRVLRDAAIDFGGSPTCRAVRLLLLPRQHGLLPCLLPIPSDQRSPEYNFISLLFFSYLLSSCPLMMSEILFTVVYILHSPLALVPSVYLCHELQTKAHCPYFILFFHSLSCFV